MKTRSVGTLPRYSANTSASNRVWAAALDLVARRALRQVHPVTWFAFGLRRHALGRPLASSLLALCAGWVNARLHLVRILERLARARWAWRLRCQAGQALSWRRSGGGWGGNPREQAEGRGSQTRMEGHP